MTSHPPLPLHRAVRTRLGLAALLGLAAGPAIGLAIGLALGLALGLSGCVNWQASYDEAARNQCRASPDAAERRACLDRASDNSREKRADHRAE